MKNKPRLLRITTVPISLKILLQGQLSFFRHHGFEVMAASADGPEVASLLAERIRHEVVPMTRKITPFKDIVALLGIIWIIRKFRPDIIHTHTPKAGLLGMAAAWICRVNVRIHTVAGLPVMETKGVKRWLLRLTEKITYACAHKIYPNSYGLYDYIMKEFHIPSSKMVVIGRGSTNGIDTRFFQRSEGLTWQANQLRSRYSIQPQDIVFSFVGRIVRDKGIGELLEAYKRIIRYEPPSALEASPGSLIIHQARRFFLLLIGPFEQDLDPLPEEDFDFLQEHPQIILAGFQVDVRPWIMASDVFVFPSYREGFPNVVMQACCMEVPCIVSDINGCNEIIQDNKTGLIVKPKDADALYEAMVYLAESNDKRKSFAVSARQYVVQNFDQKYVWNELHSEYKMLLMKPATKRKRNFYVNFFKPLTDKIIALVALIVASPFLLMAMILLFFANKGKVWFTQLRPGKDEKIFKVVKFRTMTDERDVSGNLLPDEKRLTWLGKLIRKTSLDELPQMVNVLKGDMAIVGPRPLLVEYLSLYNEDQRQRHCVKPGITGWAQVNGRNTLSWKQKFDYDLWYVKHISFALDVKILFLTVLKVLKAEGISSETSLTMEKFTGDR